MKKIALRRSKLTATASVGCGDGVTNIPFLLEEMYAQGPNCWGPPFDSGHSEVGVTRVVRKRQIVTAA